MANAIYPKFKEALLKGDVDLDTADVRAILIDATDYTYSSAHDFLDDVAAGARVATTATLTGVSTTDGTLDFGNSTFASATGDESEALIFYIHDGGADSARRLICYIDTGVTGLPVTPNGADITLTINNVFTL